MLMLYRLQTVTKNEDLGFKLWTTKNEFGTQSSSCATILIYRVLFGHPNIYKNMSA